MDGRDGLEQEHRCPSGAPASATVGCQIRAANVLVQVGADAINEIGRLCADSRGLSATLAATLLVAPSCSCPSGEDARLTWNGAFEFIPEVARFCCFISSSLLSPPPQLPYTYSSPHMSLVGHLLGARVGHFVTTRALHGYTLHTW